jgi:Tfp pilus assembly protein PilV
MRGLTILETLISILIFSIIAVALGLAVVAGKNALFTNDIPAQLRQNLLFAIVSMSQELRQTAPAKTSLGANSSSNSITFQIPNDNNGDGLVVDAFGNIEWSVNITYARNGANALTRTQGGTTSVVSSNISALQFTRPAGEDNILQIDITAQRANTTGNWQDTEQAIIKMRN